MTHLAVASLHAVILAGGAGARFWPKSRHRLPKPFLQVLDGKSLFAATLERARRFAAPERIWVVCAPSHARAVKRESGLPASRILIEPQSRNTAMAIGYAAARIAAEDPEAVLAVLPADHRVPDAKAFASAIRRAARVATQENVLVTLGVQPTRPETGYGYIEVGAETDAKDPGFYSVRRFVEKPNLAQAKRFLARKKFLWNSGVFVWSAAVILQEIETCAPVLHRALIPIRQRTRGARGKQALAEAYGSAPSLPIDIAILEKSRRVWTLPVDFHWSDVGTWASLAAEIGVDAQTNGVLGGEVKFLDAHGNLVWGEGRLVVLLGTSRLAVIDTGDVLLVADLARSPEIKNLVEYFSANARKDLL